MRIQSQTSKLSEGRENASDPITIGFSFESDWLRKWCNQSKYKVIQNQKNPKLLSTFKWKLFHHYLKYPLNLLFCNNQVEFSPTLKKLASMMDNIAVQLTSCLSVFQRLPDILTKKRSVKDVSATSFLKDINHTVTENFIFCFKLPI